MSVTDRSALDEFLHSALMREDAFIAEKQHLVVLDTAAFEPKGRKAEYSAAPFTSPAPSVGGGGEQGGGVGGGGAIPIPRRPVWTVGMSGEELGMLERDAFLAWRRGLAVLEEEGDVALTPFEKNVEVWKQLWRVIERCSVVATIVDARNPLLYRSPDLEAYVREMGERGTGGGGGGEGGAGEGGGSGAGGKVNVLVVNKADYLTLEQRRVWVRYFDREGVRAVFWSAVRSAKDEEEKERKEKERATRRRDREARRERGLISSTRRASLQDDDEHDGGDVQEQPAHHMDAALDEQAEEDEDEQEGDVEQDEGECGEEKEQGIEEDQPSASSPSASAPSVHGNSTDILTRDQLLDYFRAAYHSLHPTHSSSSSSSPSSPATSSPSPTSRIQVGFVGFPNVGKSSTINALVLQKRVTVGATPGKTKHFQTLNVADDLTLCDCPGLVMPSFLASRAELVCNGVMPIDQMREYNNYVQPVALMVRRVGAEQLKEQYSLVFPHWTGDDEADDDDTTAGGGSREEEYRKRAVEVLNAHARMRGWMKDHGRPDESRSARILLKDLFLGKLLYCYQPPGMTEEEREEWRRGVVKGRKGERIVGEWKGEGGEEEGEGQGEGDDTAVRLRAERGMREGGKVNVRVMQQMMQDEKDVDELRMGDAAAAGQGGEMSKKAMLRERQREKRRTGKAWKLKKVAVQQGDVQMKMGGLSGIAAGKMGLVQSSPRGTPTAAESRAAGAS